MSIAGHAAASVLIGSMRMSIASRPITAENWRPLGAVGDDGAQTLNECSIVAEQQPRGHFPGIEQEAIILGLPAVGLAIVAGAKAGGFEQGHQLLGRDGAGRCEQDVRLLKAPEMAVVIFDDDGCGDDQHFGLGPAEFEYQVEPVHQPALETGKLRAVEYMGVPTPLDLEPQGRDPGKRIVPVISRHRFVGIGQAPLEATIAGERERRALLERRAEVLEKHEIAG